MTAEAQQEQPQRGGALVRIVDTPNNILKSFQEFQALKKQIITDEDIQVYKEGNATKSFIKKSGWKKIATAFALDVQVVDRETIIISEGHLAIKYTVRATAPSGRYADGVGSCDSHEDRFEEKVWDDKIKRKVPTGVYKYKYNDLDGTAYTRAANRAISDLVGGGEVSAEEVSGSSSVTPAVSELPQKLQDRLGQLAEISEDSYDELARLVLMEIGTKFLTVEQATRVGKQLAEKYEKKAAPSPDKKAAPSPDKKAAPSPDKKAAPAPANQKPTAEDIKAKAADFEDAEARPIEPEDEDW